jgi:signal transduction histidine kinase
MWTTADREEMVNMSIDLLRQMPLFASLPDEDLDRLLRYAKRVDVAAGETVIEEGSQGSAVYVVLDGELEVCRRSGTHEVHLRTLGAHAFVGEMALLSGGIRSATVRATVDSQLLMIDQEAVRHLLSTSASASLILLRTVMARIASTEELLIHHHKLASLGTLAAGIAHELNNPVAAMSRSAGQLSSAVLDWQRASEEVGQLLEDDRVREVVGELHSQISVKSPTSPQLDALVRSELEDEVSDWLEHRHIPDGWNLAAVFVDSGWDVRKLDALADRVDDRHVSVVIRWAGSGLTSCRLLGDIDMATTRIADLVDGIKSYVNLDRAPVQDVDIREGIANSLSILRHKIGNVHVKETFEPDLPKVEAYPGELNQVWTNLIDNALDAMEGRGELTIRAYQNADSVVVEIGDTGPGIPEQLQSQIFDPFFTTKAPGVGTGLGLHVTYNVVVVRHHGEIKVISRPGMSRFQVKIPIRLETE